MFTIIMGFCALAVDLTRAEVAKTELQRIADSAAQAGATQVAGGTTAIQTAITAEISQYNLVDGSSLQASDVTFTTGFWDISNNTYTINGTPLNAVRVIASRSTSNGDPLPMFFAQALGKSTLDVWAGATAAKATIASFNVNISAKSNPWLAGTENQTAGSIQASVPIEPSSDYDPTTLANNTSSSNVHPWEFDLNGPPGSSAKSGEPYTSPQLAEDSSGNALSLQAGDVITVSNVTGTINNTSTSGKGSTPFTANGLDGGSMFNYSDVGASPGSTTYPAPGYSGTGNPTSPTDATGSENYISNINVPINSMIGVFLTGTSATGTGAVPQQLTGSNMPPGLDFSTQTARDYTTIDPQAQQSFYMGTGETSTNQTQSIVVPPNAGRLYMGTMDGQEWSNNLGSFTATITQYRVELVQ